MATCLILGGADCLQDDIAAAKECVDFQAVGACNDAGIEWAGKLAFWVTLHPEFWTKKGWLAAREARGFSPAPLYTHKLRVADQHLPATVTPWAFPGQIDSGSSGMFAAKVALVDLGFDMAVLCGIPMTPTPHFFGGENWSVADRYLKRWVQVAPEYKARLRSMSGATRELLGAPA